MFNSHKRLSRIIIILIIFAVIISAPIVIVKFVNTVKIEFTPESVQKERITSDGAVLDRFDISDREKRKIIANPDEYCVVNIIGVSRNTYKTSVCDIIVNVKTSEKGVYFKCNTVENESPAFDRTAPGESRNYEVSVLTEKSYVNGMSEDDFLSSLTFSAKALKYSDEKFERVYGS